MCVMINVVLETRNQSLKLCTFDGVDMVSCRLWRRQRRHDSIARLHFTLGVVLLT